MRSLEPFAITLMLSQASTPGRLTTNVLDESALALVLLAPFATTRTSSFG